MFMVEHHKPDRQHIPMPVQGCLVFGHSCQIPVVEQALSGPHQPCLFWMQLSEAQKRPMWDATFRITSASGSARTLSIWKKAAMWHWWDSFYPDNNCQWQWWDSLSG
jgi:hypothetical protein